MRRLHAPDAVALEALEICAQYSRDKSSLEWTCIKVPEWSQEAHLQERVQAGPRSPAGSTALGRLLPLGGWGGGEGRAQANFEVFAPSMSCKSLQVHTRGCAA